MQITSPLTEMSKRFEDNPDFMAYVLAQYRQQNHITEDDLLNQLQISEPLYGRLAMCKRPLEDWQFDYLADYTEANKYALRLILDS